MSRSKKILQDSGITIAPPQWVRSVTASFIHPAPTLCPSGRQCRSDLLGTPNDRDDNKSNNQRGDDHNGDSDESKYDSNKGDEDDSDEGDKGDSSERDKGDGNDTSTNEDEKDLTKDMDNDDKKGPVKNTDSDDEKGHAKDAIHTGGDPNANAGDGNIVNDANGSNNFFLSLSSILI